MKETRFSGAGFKWLVFAILVISLVGLVACDPDNQNFVFTGPTRAPTPAATPTLAPEACLPSSSTGVLVQGTNATVYAPDSRWLDPGSLGTTGVEVVPIETKSGLGTGGAVVTVPTANLVNSCSANANTGQVVCVANNTDVYIITGSTLTKTLTSGSNAIQSFSGGHCNNCGVVVDSSQNKALITMGLSPDGPGGYQFVDLGASPTLETPPIAAGTSTTSQKTSEDASIDPIRHFVLSPSELSNYQILDISAGTTSAKVFNNQISPFDEFDSAGEDCTTGIALATIEFTGDLFLADLTQAKFDNTHGTWSDTASQVQHFPEFTESSLSFGTNGIAVAPGSHFGIVTGEFGGNIEGVIQLPSKSGSGTPMIPEWVQFTVPDLPDTTPSPFSLGFDPHTVTAYVSPNSGKALGVLTSVVNSTPHFLAVIDLEGVLKAPRTAEGHIVDPTFDLVAHKLVTFVKVM